MRNSILIVIGIVALGAVTYAWAKPTWLPLPTEDGVFCTMEAKLCPDGSYVGRSGPNCEFAACPAGTSTSATIQIRIAETKGAFNVSITPLEVLEDSRCPLDVQCIQAGTVRVRAQLTSGLGAGEQIFILNQPITTEAEVITLVDASPAPYSQQTILAANYVFTFKIEKR